MNKIRSFVSGWRWSLGAGAVVACLLFISQLVCLPGLVRFGEALDHCPDGTPGRDVYLSAFGLVRGANREISLQVRARFVDSDGYEHNEDLSGFSAEVWLVDPAGQVTALTPEDGWSGRTTRRARVTLPVVNDGDYRLRARVKTGFGEDLVEAPLPLYAAARVHVLTDRPLYQPGDSVLFRAVVVRASDLTPLDGRPGTWQVTDPNGEVLLEERSDAANFGVARGSFPLHSLASVGEWRVSWRSGDASAASNFTVEPFQLPRFKVEASSARPFWRAGERPTAKGTVTYASGAAVPNATVGIDWRVIGEWPPPHEWLESALPRQAKTDAQGKFKLELPVVPFDLRGRVTLQGAIAATDDTGDRVEGSLSVLLVEETLSLSAVTELQGGLVEGFNNRLFVRVSSADGSPLPGASVTLKRTWDPADKGMTAVADEDAVAAFQVDPGAAVNVVIPAMPYRPRAGGEVPSTAHATLLADEEPLGLADSQRLERFAPRFDPCGRFLEVDEAGVSEPLGVDVDATGRVVDVAAPPGPLGRCLASVARGLQLNPGERRTFALQIELAESALPMLEVALQGAPQFLEEVEQALMIAAADARACLPRSLEEGTLPRQGHWRARAGSRKLQVSFAAMKGEDLVRIDPARLDCIAQKFAGLELPTDAHSDSLGVARFSVYPVGDEAEQRPMATTFLGYEFDVLAQRADEPVGKAKLRLVPGAVPPLRIRAEPVLARVGDTVRLTLLRGPNYSEALPRFLYVHTTRGDPVKLEVDATKRTAAWNVPKDREGWVEVSTDGDAFRDSDSPPKARTFVFAQPSSSLALEVKPERERYAPGDVARLAISTREGERGISAAVGLFGVDDSLGQLASLPGADQLESLRPSAMVAQKAFGALDGVALASGRIRGANAAAATVLQVHALPERAGADAPVAIDVSNAFDPNADLVDRFFTVATELQTRVRQWEEKQPAEVALEPQAVAKLWKDALEACRSRGDKVEDGYGRPLRLSTLPPDLLSLVDPRNLVSSGTRLSEDVEDWNSWVAREVP